MLLEFQGVISHILDFRTTFFAATWLPVLVLRTRVCQCRINFHWNQMDLVPKISLFARKFWYLTVNITASALHLPSAATPSHVPRVDLVQCKYGIFPSKPRTPFPLMSLPPEIQLQILKHLNLWDATALCLANNHFYSFFPTLQFNTHTRKTLVWALAGQWSLSGWILIKENGEWFIRNCLRCGEKVTDRSNSLRDV